MIANQNFAEFQFVNLDNAKINKALKMIQDNHFNLYSQLTTDTVFGVVRSQRDQSLIYACYLRADGSYGCQTQNLNSCGGLRGSLCKHIIVLLNYMANFPATRSILQSWINKTLPNKPCNDKNISAFIFSKFQEATGYQMQNFGNFGFDELPILENIEVNEVLHTFAPHIVNSPRPSSITIIESHVSLENSVSSPINLQLNYVLCMGDRRREQTNNLGNWHNCKKCNNWICPECFDLFMSETENCPSEILGLKRHKFMI